MFQLFSFKFSMTCYTSIFTFFLLGEIRNLTTLSLLPLVNNCFSLSSFFQSLLYFLWIGAQFPQVKFLSYGRILTLHYYFLLMCILFSKDIFFLFFFYTFFIGTSIFYILLSRVCRWRTLDWNLVQVLILFHPQLSFLLTTFLLSRAVDGKDKNVSTFNFPFKDWKRPWEQIFISCT